MRKMRLKLDGLRVESFSTAGTAKIRGTVQAHSAYPCATYDTECGTGEPSTITCPSGCGNLSCGLDCEPTWFRGCEA